MKILSPIIILLLGIAANFIFGEGLFDGDVLKAQTPSERVQAAIESRNDPASIIRPVRKH